MSNELEEAETQLHKVQSDLGEAIKLMEADTPVMVNADGRPIVPRVARPRSPGTMRGIETLFKSSYRVQMDLTSLADNKANMMISINGIIMSIILAAVAPKLDSNPWLLLPTAILLVGSLISMVYAILAARPRVSHHSITLSDLKHSKGNILFFGNFANMAEEDFVAGMKELMLDKPLIYDTMMRNIHGLGNVLNKKFALLQIAYTAFMVALILGVSSFLCVFIWVLLRTT